MTVSDPLIKDLKGWTRKLIEYENHISDDNQNFTVFCTSLERCIEKGIAIRQNVFGLPKEPEAWYCLQNLASRNERSLYILSSIIESVIENTKINTPTGRLRLFIRICLTRRYLHVPFEFLVRTQYLAKEYYNNDSIIGNEILGEIFISVLLQISKLYFRLNLRNSSFLDETWQLPECIALELVPCKTLGISVCFTRGKALIIRIDENSVAAEDDKVQVGDVLDEINDNTITIYSKGKLQKIMRKAIGQPISLHIIKHRNKHSNEIYEPIANIINSSGIDHMKQLLKPAESSANRSYTTESENRNFENKYINSGFAVKYCGSVSTGSLGDVKQIEKAMWRLLHSNNVNKIPVFFECLELSINITRGSDGNVILQRSYMEISSCGRTANISNYFAFIAGETSCSVAKKFDAHIFYHEDSDEVQLILQSIGQGFQRTHYAV